MSEIIHLANLSISQLSTKKFFEDNKKFVEAITIIDNLDCSFITKTAYAADLIDAFNAAFLIQNTVKITYDEIDKIINEAKNQNNDCDLGLFIKDLYNGIIDKAYETNDKYIFTMDIINSINKLQLENSIDIVLNDSFATQCFNSIKKMALSIDALSSLIDDLNNEFLNNYKALKD